MNHSDMPSMNIVAVLTFIFSLTASATGFQDALRECVQEKDWSKVECVYYSGPPEERYEKGLLHTYVDDPFEKTLYNGLSTLHRIAYDGVDLLCPELHSESVANGKAILKAIVPELRRVKEKRNLTACRSACLVKCASSKLMKHTDGKWKKLTSLEDAVGTGKGECTEFAKLALYLGDKLDVKTRYASGPSHAFVEFEIDGKWYGAEPDSQSCVFW